MTLLIPLLLRLTALFERGVRSEDPPSDSEAVEDDAKEHSFMKE